MLRVGAGVAGIAAVGLTLALTGRGPANGAAQRVEGPQGESSASFADLVRSLSEPGGYFNTDNLISNERSYLHVAPDLRRLATSASRNGVYLGVGPDQNFSYIAHVRPALAILVDIRRDNLLLHLLFKALFAEARTRLDYLALLTGRGPPESGAGSSTRSIETLVNDIDGARPMAGAGLTALHAKLTARLKSFGVPLSADDLTTIDGFHRRFIAAGLSLQFNTTGRAPQYDYPTYRDLLVEVDRQGVRQNFLAREEDFQFVKDLQARNAVLPIVGDLGGRTALAAVARFLASRGRQVAAFYTSNVEFYLFREGGFGQFMANLAQLPHAPDSVIVRSVFPGGGGSPHQAPGYNSASLTQSIQALLDGYAAGRFRQYWELTR
jgi:hypothetical protein